MQVKVNSLKCTIIFAQPTKKDYFFTHIRCESIFFSFFVIFTKFTKLLQYLFLKSGNKKDIIKSEGRILSLITLRQIEKSYHSSAGCVHALKNINLSIVDGESVAIVGQSGSGKSTLMNILGLLDISAKGEYILNGRNINTLSADERSLLRSRELGFVFQGFNLLSRMSALENVELPLIYANISREKRRELALGALEQVGLSHRVFHRPSEMSGGQQQRVAIARAIIRSPSILLADEPTGNLDSSSGKEILDLLCDLNRRGSTVILITHDNDIAKCMSRCIRISDGCIVYDSKFS